MSNYQGGWSASASQRAKNLKLPAKVECSICRRQRDLVHFSNRQLESLKHKTVASGRNKYDYGPRRDKNEQTSSDIRCRSCTNQQNNELLCIMCSEVKDLSEFAKVQRRDPDNARCLVCSEEIKKVGEDDDDRVGIAYDDISDDDYGDYVVDDTKSTSTGISLVWATYEDGDYVTASDVSSGRYVSEHGSDVHKSTGGYGRSRRGGSRLNPEYDGSFDSRGPIVSINSHNLTTASGTSTQSAQEDGGMPTSDGAGWTVAGSSKGKKKEHSASRDGQAFNAWGPQGQNSTRFRTLSPGSSNSTARGGAPEAGRRSQRSEDNANRKFPKIRPENNPRKFPKVRPEKSKIDEDEGEDSNTYGAAPTAPWAANMGGRSGNTQSYW